VALWNAAFASRIAPGNNVPAINNAMTIRTAFLVVASSDLLLPVFGDEGSSLAPRLVVIESLLIVSLP
jgi:hypothetical protein